MRKSRLGLVLILLILVGLAGGRAQPPPLPPPPFQRVTVCLEGPPKCDFTSIEAATDIVAGGGVIEVLPGIYEENVNIQKSLSILGKKSRLYEKIIVKSRNSEQPVISIGEGVHNVVIEGLEIFGSNEAGIAVNEEAQGILIKMNRIVNNENGIWIKPYAQITIDGNDFTNNGISIRAIAAKVNITHNSISIQAGIAIYGGEVIFIGNVISNSLVGVGIVADALTPATITLERNIILNNFRGLEIRTGEHATINLRGNTLNGNLLGGIIYARAIEARSNYILNSERESREGQGLIVLATERIDLVRNVFIDNEASGLLLGLSQSGEIKVENNIVLNNGGYGLTLLNPDCIHTYVIELLESIIPEEERSEIEDKFYQGQLQGEVKGSDNLIFGNKEGDLCPEDYPWPEGFVKKS